MTLRLALVLLLATVSCASAQPARSGGTGLGALGGGGLGGGLGGGKEPIKIDADRLDVFDRENKAVFAGSVVAVQGDATIRCSALTVHYKRGKRPDETPQADGAEPAERNAAMAENGIQRVDCAGPVTVKQKDQVATGDNATFDQVARRITLTGNVVLSQCQNVTRGARLVYDMNTGRANMDPGAGGRVSAMFVPGEKAEAKDGAKDGAKGGASGSRGCTTPDLSAGRPAPKAAERNVAKPTSSSTSGPTSRAQAN